MPRERHFEHLIVPVPERVNLCPRCKVALVHHPENGKPYCEKCGNDESGIPFVRLDVILDLFAAPALADRPDAVRSLYERLKQYGNPLWPAHD